MSQSSVFLISVHYFYRETSSRYHQCVLCLMTLSAANVDQSILVRVCECRTAAGSRTGAACSLKNENRRSPEWKNKKVQKEAQQVKCYYIKQNHLSCVIANNNHNNYVD